LLLLLLLLLLLPLPPLLSSSLSLPSALTSVCSQFCVFVVDS
jgi:hypothetical protein